MELEPASTEFTPVYDARPKLFSPPPVALVAVADVSLTAVAGLEPQLDGFYAELLRMDRDRAAAEHEIVYQAQNVRLRVQIQELPPPRQTLRPLGIVIPSLAELAQRLIESKIEFVRQRGVFAGSESLILSDPAGNLVEVMETGALI
jgi:catechol-2,3-dioxygenase